MAALLAVGLVETHCPIAVAKGVGPTQGSLRIGSEIHNRGRACHPSSITPRSSRREARSWPLISQADGAVRIAGERMRSVVLTCQDGPLLGRLAHRLPHPPEILGVSLYVPFKRKDVHVAGVHWVLCQAFCQGPLVRIRWTYEYAVMAHVGHDEHFPGSPLRSTCLVAPHVETQGPLSVVILVHPDGSHELPQVVGARGSPRGATTGLHAREEQRGEQAYDRQRYH